MQIKKAGGKIFGASLTAAEQKAMNMEIQRQLVEYDRKNELELDAIILWELHTQLGLGPKRLKKFFDGFSDALNALVNRYEMDISDDVWLCTHSHDGIICKVKQGITNRLICHSLLIAVRGENAGERLKTAELITQANAWHCHSFFDVGLVEAVAVVVVLFRVKHIQPHAKLAMTEHFVRFIRGCRKLAVGIQFTTHGLNPPVRREFCGTVQQ